MDELNRENISAFIDAETEDITFDNCKCWESYHLIGDAIRNNTPELMARGVLEKVKARIDLEPTIVAPNNLSNSYRPKNLAIAAGIVGAIAIGSMMWLQRPFDKPNSSATNNVNTHVVIKNGRKLQRLNDPRLNLYIARHDGAELHKKSGAESYVKVVAYPE